MMALFIAWKNENDYKCKQQISRWQIRNQLRAKPFKVQGVSKSSFVVANCAWGPPKVSRALSRYWNSTQCFMCVTSRQLASSCKYKDHEKNRAAVDGSTGNVNKKKKLIELLLRITSLPKTGNRNPYKCKQILVRFYEINKKHSADSKPKIHEELQRMLVFVFASPMSSSQI